MLPSAATQITNNTPLEGRGEGRAINLFPSPPPNLPHEGGGTNGLEFLNIKFLGSTRNDVILSKDEGSGVEV